jgi:hypothetical protein
MQNTKRGGDMRVGKEMRIAIEEIARVCLEREDICRYISHELDLSDEYIDQIYTVLEGLLNAENGEQA